MYDKDDPDHILEAKLALLGVCVERAPYPADPQSASWGYPFFVVWLRDRNHFVFIQPELQRHNTRRQALEKTLEAFGEGIEPYNPNLSPVNRIATLQDMLRKKAKRKPKPKQPSWGTGPLNHPPTNITFGGNRAQEESG